MNSQKIVSFALLGFAYHFTFHFFPKNEEGAYTPFFYHFLQSNIILNFISLSWLVSGKYKREALAAWAITSLSFLSAMQVSLWSNSEYFTEMRKDETHKIFTGIFKNLLESIWHIFYYSEFRGIVE